MELVKREDHYGLYNDDGHKIAATIDGCNSKLSKENCDEIFKVIDVEKLADKYFSDKPENIIERIGFTVGFTAAMALNKDKLFTAEDMRQAYDDGMNNIGADGCVIDNPDEDFIDTLKCIQQPTEIKVTFNPDKKDSEGCLILKRVI